MKRRGLLMGALAGLPPAQAGLVPLDRFSVLWMFSSGQQRDLWVRMARRFAAEPGATAPASRELEQGAYKADFESHLRATPAAADVMLWFAGHRLQEMVEADLLEPLDELAAAGQWPERFFPAALDAVRVKGRLYALPLSTYQWGFYYRRSLFARLGLTPPKDWAQWLQVNEALRRAGVAPITLAAKDLWPLGGWLDYFNLRLNGRAFHLALLAGRESWLDPRVREALERWALLVHRGDFLDKPQERDWRQSLPYLSRGHAGMALLGNFAVLQLPAEVRADLGFFPFPVLNARQAPVEVAPLDVLVLPKRAHFKAEAQRFLRFAAGPEIQSELNAAMGLMAPQREARAAADPLVQAGVKLLSQAAGLTQYFDRDTPSAFSAAALPVLSELVQGRLNPPEVQQRLEALRHTVFQSGR